MTKQSYTPNGTVRSELGRRKTLSALLTTSIAMTAIAHPLATLAQKSPAIKENKMKTKAFVYTEMQNSVRFDDVPWEDLNIKIAKEPGFLNKTWFSGIGNNSVGGIYSFDSIENAQRYCTTFFPAISRTFGVAQTTRVFDASLVKNASIDMGSPHFGIVPTQKPGAFVYTEVQVNIPFENAPWQDRNPALRKQKGLLSKMWLSGLNTNTLGGVDAFDTIENALAFAIEDFPKTTAKMNAAFYTRVFNANASEAASRALNSPFYV